MDTKTFQTILAEKIAERGWTTAHLVAALADRGYAISVYSVDQWLAGISSPRARLIAPVAECLGCTPNDLLCPDTAETP